MTRRGFSLQRLRYEEVFLNHRHLEKNRSPSRLTLSRAIRLAREELELSQEDFAERADGVAFNAVELRGQLISLGPVTFTMTRFQPQEVDRSQ